MTIQAWYRVKNPTPLIITVETEISVYTVIINIFTGLIFLNLILTYNYRGGIKYEYFRN